MKGKVVTMIVALGAIAFLASCAAIQKISPSAGPTAVILERIAVNYPVTVGVGETVELSADGYDADIKEVKFPLFNPTWTVETPECGKIDKTKGVKVNFTGLVSGWCTIIVEQGEIKQETKIKVE